MGFLAMTVQILVFFVLVAAVVKVATPLFFFQKIKFLHIIFAVAEAALLSFSNLDSRIVVKGSGSID